MSRSLGHRLTRVDAFDDGVNAWSMARITPPDALRGLIDGYCDYAERTGGFTTRRELPHGDGVFIFNLGDPIVITGGDGREIRLRAGEAFVAGVHVRPALSGSFGAQAGVHIYLPLESLRRLLGMPVHELVDQVVPLDAILGADARAICEPLRDANDRDRRIALLDCALMRRFAVSAPLAARQSGALDLLRRRPDLDIAAIADHVGWSRKHLAERVKDAVGIGPRSYRRLLRFQRLTEALRDVAPPNWARLALDAGYCDQSHMIREFREFADLTPSEYLARSLPHHGGLVEA